MAFLDDKTWLLSFIRNQFIVSDDTSMCENLIGSEYAEHESDNTFFEISETVSGEDGEAMGGRSRGASSPDITMNMDTRMSRRRSNTTVRLEKVRKEREEKSQIKTTNWKSTLNLRDPSERAQVPHEIFPDVKVPARSTHAKQSALSQEIGVGDSGVKIPVS